MSNDLAIKRDVESFATILGKQGYLDSYYFDELNNRVEIDGYEPIEQGVTGGCHRDGVIDITSNL